MTAAPGGQGGQMPSGGQGGAPGGAGAAAGGMPMMMGGSQNVDFSKNEGSCCGGLGVAFLSGYCAGIYIADYLNGN
jgi:hypothetical protein